MQCNLTVYSAVGCEADLPAMHRLTWKIDCFQLMSGWVPICHASFNLEDWLFSTDVRTSSYQSADVMQLLDEVSEWTIVYFFWSIKGNLFPPNRLFSSVSPLLSESHEVVNNFNWKQKNVSLVCCQCKWDCLCFLARSAPRIYHDVHLQTDTIPTQ